MKIDSSDDAIHTNSGNVLIKGGALDLTTLDDGIHADELVKIDGGEITVNDSYEGIEGAYVEIGGGTIYITASDDGINAASDDESVSEHIIISGGTITVDASGDGLDSNGRFTSRAARLSYTAPRRERTQDLTQTAESLSTTATYSSRQPKK